MKKIKELFVKFKSIKNVEIYLALLLGIVVIAVVFLSNGTNKEKSSQSIESDSYISQMEHKIVSVVEKIDGCGKVTVAISHDSYEETVYAYETEKNDSNGKITETTSVVSVKGSPLVVKTLPPNILGVVIVAEGADNPVVKFKIKEAVVTLLGVDVSKVQVFTYKS